MPYRDRDVGRAYQRKYQLDKYYIRKTMAIEYLGGKCVDCGSSNPTLLEFDHKSQAEKSFTITTKLGSSSWKSLKEELDKCQLRCIPCHGHVTAFQKLQKIDILGAVF